MKLSKMSSSDTNLPVTSQKIGGSKLRPVHFHRSNYIVEFPWCSNSARGSGFAQCKLCQCSINVRTRGRSALQDHEKTRKHMDAYEAAKRSTDVSGYCQQSEAEKYFGYTEVGNCSDEDEKPNFVINARNSLELQAFSMKIAFERIQNRIQDTIKWLDKNQMAKREEYECRKNLLEEFCKSALRSVHCSNLNELIDNTAGITSEGLVSYSLPSNIMASSKQATTACNPKLVQSEDCPSQDGTSAPVPAQQLQAVVSSLVERISSAIVTGIEAVTQNASGTLNGKPDKRSTCKCRRKKRKATQDTHQIQKSTSSTESVSSELDSDDHGCELTVPETRRQVQSYLVILDQVIARSPYWTARDTHELEHLRLFLQVWKHLRRDARAKVWQRLQFFELVARFGWTPALELMRVATYPCEVDSLTLQLTGDVPSVSNTNS